MARAAVAFGALKPQKSEGRHRIAAPPDKQLESNLRDQCLKIGSATSTAAGTPMMANPVKRVFVFAATGIFTAMVSGKRGTLEEAT
jgi:hypothetical protein